MTNEEARQTETVTETDATLTAQPVPEPAWIGVVSWLVRALARAWVIGLLLFSAAFAGIGAYKAYETRAELTEIRKAPGPQSYAVVAYRRELARQIRAYSRNWRDSDAVPQPPSRPRILSEIDAARQRGADLNRPPPPPRQTGEGMRP